MQAAGAAWKLPDGQERDWAAGITGPQQQTGLFLARAHAHCSSRWLVTLPFDFRETANVRPPHHHSVLCLPPSPPLAVMAFVSPLSCEGEREGIRR